MTKKHYEFLAKIMGEMRAGKCFNESKRDLIMFLKKDNPRFDITKFMRAVEDHSNKY